MYSMALLNIYVRAQARCFLIYNSAEYEVKDKLSATGLNEGRESKDGRWNDYRQNYP